MEPLKLIESRGAVDTTRRVARYCSHIFAYAIAYGKAENNPASDLTIAIKSPQYRELPAITEPERIAQLMRSIDGFQGSLIVRCALRLLPLVFTRPGELRKAEWSEIDLEGALWTIPAARMKKRRDHLVPLSKQASEILKEIEPLTGEGKYVFPANWGGGTRPMSENTLSAVLQRLGYDQSEMVPHGFRTMASTRLHEMGWESRVIETQLAHSDKDRIRGIYNRAEYLEERTRMMQSWADYLDSLKAGADVIPINKKQPG